METKKIFYGWRMVAAGVIILAVGLGMFTSTNSLFVIPVSEEFGVSRAQFTFHRTIITLVGAISMMVYGKLVQRIGVKKIMLMGALMLALVTFTYSFTQNLWQFYALAFVNGMFLQALNFMVIGILVSDWFVDKKGLATGIAFAGSGLGGAIMLPIVSRVMELTDWRTAYQFMGALGLAILLPVIFFMVKEKPEKLGLEPYTDTNNDTNTNTNTDNDTNTNIEGNKNANAEASNKVAQKNKAPVFNLSFRKARKTSRFWLILSGFFLITFFAAATNTHTAPFLIDLGYSPAMVSAVVSAFMVALTVGKIILGYVYDRFGIMAGHICIFICCLTFPVAALFSHIPAFTWVYAITMGLASCAVSVPVSIMLIRYFGQRDFPVIFSFFTMLITLSAAISVPLMGLVYDYTGSYNFAWYAIFGISVAVTFCMLLAELFYKRAASAATEATTA